MQNHGWPTFFKKTIKKTSNVNVVSFYATVRFMRTKLYNLAFSCPGYVLWSVMAIADISTSVLIENIIS